MYCGICGMLYLDCPGHESGGGGIKMTTLSDNIWGDGYGQSGYERTYDAGNLKVKDVRESVRKIKKLIFDVVGQQKTGEYIHRNSVWKIIEKEIGDKLI